MAEAEATISSEAEVMPQPETNNQEIAPEKAAPAPPAKRGRGRPAGSKDLKPRTSKPKVRIEPIPQAVEPERAQPVPEATSSSAPAAAQDTEAPPEPEPPSPRTLYRQTSQQLLSLRDLMNEQRRASSATKYTDRLTNWPIV